jgi:type IV pilus assembly protein PilQ
VRAALKLIADFSGLNIVASDSVKGSLSLRLHQVSANEALALVLKSKGLAKRQHGDIILVGPIDEIAGQEKQALEASQYLQDLIPLHAEFIQINYAKAADLAMLLKNDKTSLLSSRASVAVDPRTNTLLVQDVAEKIKEVHVLIEKLDVPTRQVLIESRIVVANEDFDHALGVQFGAAFNSRKRPIINSLNNNVNPGVEQLLEGLHVNLPNTKGQFTFSIGRLAKGTLLDLELSALESEGLGKVISSPRLVTSDQQKAFIESGEEIPYQESARSGATTVAFKKAVLRLEVEPQITPDKRIVLNLAVNQDSMGRELNNIPAVNTNKIQTKVLVENGETVVLGGIYTHIKKNKIERIPFLGKLPIIGWLFRNEHIEDHRQELMIFVTPTIIEGAAW